MSNESTEILHVKFEDHSLVERLRVALDKYFILKVKKEDDTSIVNYYNHKNALTAMGAYPINPIMFKGMHLDDFFAPPAVRYDRRTHELSFHLSDKDFFSQLLKFEQYVDDQQRAYNATQVKPRTQIGDYESTTDRIWPEDRHEGRHF